MASWTRVTERAWELNIPGEHATRHLVGRVIWGKDVRGATGWTAWARGAPRSIPSYTGRLTYRPLENVGDFRYLRDAMRHVMVLYKLEQ